MTWGQSATRGGRVSSSGRRLILVEQFLDLVGGGSTADPGVELVEVGAAGDLFAYRVWHLDAVGVEECQHRPGLAFGLTLGFAFGVVAAGGLPLCAARAGRV